MPLDALLLVAWFTAFVVLALVVPMVRSWVRHGVFAFVAHRRAAPMQRLMGALLVALVLGFGAFVFSYAAWGPERLGVWPAPALLRALGALLGVAGIAVMVVAQAQMGASWRIGVDDRPTALVHRGLYRHVRHPIYLGFQLGALGAGLALPSVIAAILVVGIALAVGVQARMEERFLLGLHGESYRSYSRKVGRFLPGIGRLSDGSA